jgi:hypothetical protein
MMNRKIDEGKKKTAMRRFVAREIEAASDAQNRRFRVYDLNAGTFYPETEEFFLSSSGDRLMTENGQPLSLKENVIQHCTGERDVKDRLIYQGDILRTDEAGWTAAVVWGEGQFCLEDERGGFSALPNWNCCEIVGDIFSMELHAGIDLAAEDAPGMKFWKACWNGEYGDMKSMLPDCRNFVNRNIKFTECGVRKILCLPLIAALNHLRDSFPNENAFRCLELLLENGADPHKKCEDMGETPISFARRKNRAPVPDILQKHKRLKNSKTGDEK